MVEVDAAVPLSNTYNRHFAFVNVLSSSYTSSHIGDSIRMYAQTPCQIKCRGWGSSCKIQGFSAESEWRKQHASSIEEMRLLEQAV